MTLQAWIDDSGSQPKNRFFVLGGFVADHVQWALFSDEWKAVLNRGPHLAYFKMNESMTLSGQFKGWNEAQRDSTLLALAEVIKRNVRIRISASIRNSDHARYISLMPAIERRLATDTPYVHLANSLMTRVILESGDFGLDQPIDFYFDEQDGFDAELLEFWPVFKASLKWVGRGDLLPKVGSPPAFRDDKEFLPLQAADMYAWLIRDHMTRNDKIIVPMRSALQAVKSIPAVYSESTPANLKEIHRHLAEVGLEVTKDSGVELKFLAADRAGQRRARKKARRCR